jgi:regulator of chromosome condensation
MVPEAEENKEEEEKAPKKARLVKTPTAAPAKPYVNPLPTVPEKVRPAPQLFVWGAGNFGQFGMGPDVLGELPKPRKNPWVEKKIEEGVFGEPEAGIESIVAGGLHTLFVDEKGTVCEHFRLELESRLNSPCRYGLVE